MSKLTKKNKTDIEKAFEKAGVEIKLTRSELADYIAVKAEEAILKEQQEIQKKLGYQYMHLSETIEESEIPERFLNVFKELKKLDSGFRASFAMNAYHLEDVYISFSNKENFHFNNGSISFNVSKEEVNDKFRERLALCERLNELNQKLQFLNQKKHKTLMVETFLGKTPSGLQVKVELDKVVEKILS